MTPPILFAVDEDPVVVAELESQLVQRYGRDYRVESLRDPDQALTRLKELSEARAAPVALQHTLGKMKECMMEAYASRSLGKDKAVETSSHSASSGDDIELERALLATKHHLRDVFAERDKSTLAAGHASEGHHEAQEPTGPSLHVLKETMLDAFNSRQEALRAPAWRGVRRPTAAA